MRSDLRTVATALVLWAAGTMAHGRSVDTLPDPTVTAVTAAPAVTESTPATYPEAIAALGRDDWAAAAASLRAIVAREPSAAAYYNLAFAAHELDDRATAVWAAASSAALGGVSGLRELRRLIEAQVPPEQRGLPPTTLERVTSAVEATVGTNALVGFGLASLLVGCALLVFVGSRGRAMAFWALAAALVTGWVAFRQNRLAHPSTAVVATAGPVYTAPSSGSAVVAVVGPGASVDLGERLTGYGAVALPTGQRGWMPLERLLEVDPLGGGRQ